MAPEPPSVKEMLEHGWRDFSLHAGQRLQLFNFFIVLSGSLTAALAACIQKDGLFLAVGIALGAFLAVLSIVFWKLDQRTAFLVKHAEDGIMELEAAFPIATAKLLTREPARTASRQQGFFLSRMWTYRVAFLVVFALMGLVGVSGSLVCLVRFVGWVS